MSFMDALFGKSPSISTIPYTELYPPAVINALNQLYELGKTYPKPQEVLPGYEQIAQNLYDVFTKNILASVLPIAEYGKGNLMSMLDEITPAVKAMQKSAEADIGAAYKSSSENIQDLYNRYLKEPALKESVRLFDTMAAKGLSGSGVAQRIAEEAYMEKMYAPLLTNLSNLESSKATALSGVASEYQKALGNIANTLGVKTSDYLSNLYSNLAQSLGGYQTVLYGTLLGQYNPYQWAQGKANLLSPVANSNIQSTVVVEPGTQGLLGSLLEGLVGGAGTGLGLGLAKKM